MLSKKIKYVDYNGTEREETFFFNLSKAELTEMDLSTPGGMKQRIDNIVQELNGERIIVMFKQLIFDAYGEKSEDGRRFIKSHELSEAFSQTEAYSILFMELCTNTEAAIEFVNGIVPQDLKDA